jgi:hypothetical protein
MLEKRNIYIDSLLQELKALEKRVLMIKSDDTVPFSFFRESFNKTQEITRLLHEMEVIQVDDMKRQMERLVSFLSESENRKNEEEKAKKETIVAETPTESTIKVVEIQTEQVERIAVPEEVTEKAKIILPEYKDPRKVEHVPSPPPSVAEQITKPVAPALLDLTKGINLNDRFLFQRELFNNSRPEMDSMMLKLNSFNNYNDAERFLRETTSWDFANQTVGMFLETIQKGFR